MIDIHSHVIPNIDDGCKSIDEAIELIVKSKESGVNTIICTPHFILNRYTTPKQEVIESFNALKEEVAKRNIDVKLLLGQEIFYKHGSKICDMISDGKLLTMNNTKYVLIEFDMFNKVKDLEEVLYEFSIINCVPIIAHVERYEWITLDDIYTMKKLGCKIQINSNSCLNKSGLKKYFFTKKLLKNNLVDFIASDMHSFRPSTLALALKKYKFENKNIFE